ncbi:MAG: PqqD family protein [Thermaerobacterales bacterium]
MSGKSVSTATVVRHAPGAAPGSKGTGFSGLSYQRTVEIAEDIHRDDPAFTQDTMRPVGDELWNLMDGRRTLADICDGLCFQFDVNIPQHLINEAVEKLIDEGLVTVVSSA